MWNQMCQTQQNGKYNDLSAETIDIVVHVLSKKTLRQMHAELLHQVYLKSVAPNMPLFEQVF